jgi:hypothetical protein
MSTVKPTDKVLVNRAGIDHSTPADMSTVKDTDLLLINRAGVDYNCTFADWKNSQKRAPDVGSVTLADVAGGGRFTSTAFPVSATMTDDGLPTSTKKLKAYIEGRLSFTVTPNSDEITKVAGNVLTFAGAKDLANFTVGEGIRQNSAAAHATGIGFDAYISTNLYNTVAEIKANATRVYEVQPHVPVGSLLYYIPTFDVTKLTSPVLLWHNSPRGQGQAGLTVRDATSWRGLWSSCDFTSAGDYERFTIDGSTHSGPQRYGMDALFLVIAQAGVQPGPSRNAFRAPVIDSGIASGVIGSINVAAHTITLSESAGTWGPANAGHYVIGPTKTTPAANIKLYCKLNPAGFVSDLQKTDPGFTAWTPAGTGPYTGKVTFPAKLPSGQPTDADLPPGTTLTVEVEASNASGTDSDKSNTITPT